MGNLVATIRSTYPRCFGLISTDKTALTARTNSTSSWKTLWDTVYLPYCDTLVSQSDMLVAATSSGTPSDLVHRKFFMLGLAGWIENSTTYHNKLLSAAKALANNDGWWPGWTTLRWTSFAMAAAIDFLQTGVITFTDADKKTIGDSMISRIDYTNAQSPNEYIDGHTGGNYMAILHAMGALHGMSGTGFNYTATALSRINKVIDFWYGASPGGPARIETDRFFGGDGGSGKGSGYNAIAHFHSLEFLNCVSSLFSVREIAGEPYDPWVDEAWVGKATEWWLHTYFRGDGDFIPIHDSGKISAPHFVDEARWALGLLVARGGAFRKQARWLYDQLQTWENAAPPNGAGFTTGQYRRAFDVPFWDPADSANANQSPAAAGLTKSRLFSPWGDFFHVSSWDPTQKTIIYIRAPEFFYEGHSCLDVGAIGAVVRGDVVLPMQAGTYDGGWSESLAGPHNCLWYQQTIGHSGALLVDDFTINPHKAQFQATQGGGAPRTDIPSGLGGQYRKQFFNGSTTIYDPPDVGSMRNDGGGMAWRRVGSDAVGTGRFRIVSQVPGDYVFMHADTRHAYLLRHDFLGGSLERTRRVDIKWLLLEGGSVWQYPILLTIGWVESRLATFLKRQVWHTHGAPNSNMLVLQDIRRITADGYRTVYNVDASLPRGKIVIDHYRASEFQMLTVGSSIPTQNGYFQNQFAYQTGGTNYEPVEAIGAKEQSDLGRYSVHMVHSPQVTEMRFVSLLFPCLRTETPPSYSLTEDASSINLLFGPNKQYRISKTQPILVTSGDVTAPGAPVLAGALSGPGTGEITGLLVPNADDTVVYQPWYREKV